MAQTDYHLDRMAAYLAAARNSGLTCNFREATKITATKPQADYHLDRMAAARNSGMNCAFTATSKRVPAGAGYTMRTSTWTVPRPPPKIPA